MREADFKKALAVRPCVRTEHFALHHIGRPPSTGFADLSTTSVVPQHLPVDGACRFGLVVPKRHARRAVTRNLVKRQGRAAFAQARATLGSGDWLLRLRRAFDPARFVSARSLVLRQVVQAELRALFESARVRRVP